ncbi:MAG TPA: lysophospholipid acyltransferase family protein [Polyangiaceae bacterium]|nr:lysophospholipid acyltransferase family protein [Polyangiaceae bacterium]
MRTVLAILTCIELFLVASLGFVFTATVYLLTRPFDSRRILSGKALRLVSHSAAVLSPMWKFRIHGELPKKLSPKTVCVSNHCSHTDVFLICHVPWEMKWLAKRSLFKLPFIGWGMWLVGDVGVERGSAKALAALDECKSWLERGVPVMIFPEGTRSKTGETQPFKDGAFKLAIEAGADILPMAVAGTQNALSKNDWRPGFARGVLRVGKPIPTTGLTVADVGKLKQQAFDTIQALRAEILPLATP